MSFVFCSVSLLQRLSKVQQKGVSADGTCSSVRLFYTPSQAINGAPINVTVQSVFILTKKNTKDRQDLKKCSLDVSSLLRKIQIESMECDSII